MARFGKRLTAKAVATKKKPGFYADGDGLYLKVAPGGTRSWAFRYQHNGRPRWMGLGSAELVSLQEARTKAHEARRSLFDGNDPIDARKASKQAAAGMITFRDAATRYIDSQKSGWKNEKHAAQWPATLEAYVYPVFGDQPVSAIDVGMVLKALEAIWTSKTETAKRVRGRIEAILDWASARGYRGSDNPARWRGHLDKLMPQPGKIRKVRHHPAMPYAQVGSFVATLRQIDTDTARALELLILTATRTTEVREAAWSEFDMEKSVWTIPAGRMKAEREHRIPLSSRAMEILRHQASLYRAEGLVFPGRRKGQPMSEMTMLMLLRRSGFPALTVHGFRSTVRDWCDEQTNYPRHVAEMMLAHSIGDKVEAAYRRGDLFEKRRRLMAEWSEFCDRPAFPAEVVPLNVRSLHG